MKSTLTLIAASAVALALAAPLAPANAASERRGVAGTGKTAYGLTGGDRLVKFRLNRPGRARSVGVVSGLSGDTNLVGIDFRVQNKTLYGVGNAGGVYVIKRRNAQATKVSQLTVALSGSSFGVDFNPAADRLRVVSNNGQNLRHDVNPGGATIADTTLAYMGATASGIAAAAYTNNDLSDNTGTTLFDIDTAMDQLAIQAPANNGSLSPSGKLRVAAGPNAGFDITRTKRGQRGFATLRVGARYRLYTVDLLNGRVSRVGTFPARFQVQDVAVPVGR